MLFSFDAYSNDFLEKGKKALKTSDFDLAIELFEKALNKCKINTCHDTLLAEIRIYQGKTYQLLDKHDLAIAEYRKGLKRYRKVNNLNGEVFALVSIAEFYRNLTQFGKAVEFLELAEEAISEKTVSNQQKIYFFNRYAAVHNEMGDEADKVIHYSEVVIVLAKEIGDKNLEANSLNELGFVYENKRDPKAIEYYTRAYNLYKEIGNKQDLAYTIRNISRMYYLSDWNHEKSLEYANKGIALIDSTDWTSLKVSLYHYKYESLFQLERYKEAVLAVKKSAGYRVREIELEKNKELFEVETRFSVQEKDNLIELEQRKRDLLDQENKIKSSKLRYYLVVTSLLVIVLFTTYFFLYRTKQNNKELQKNIRQKEALLQEVHHRVKNNLTVLNSLLYLQAKSIPDEKVKTILDECRSRVNSMALVHQNLYDVEDASKVDLNKFIKELVNESARIFNQDKFQLNLRNEDVSYDMGLTIFLGLILNELITNSFKYAFSENAQNSIYVKVIKEGSLNTIKYGDSGKGLTIDFDDEKLTGFGFKLIKIMLNQIDASIEYDKSINVFVIQFKDGKKV
ncbi:MAG: hypothetical protein COA33_006405 [Fluviicola sp.]|nr:hypothetical protein [Fluviicola sp.]